ncbi:MAG TPA: hypothetical protein VFK02_19330 [Kofleriaceae bacterium]|nr:hypothetical protein [Kofleriaceae bacterium]
MKKSRSNRFPLPAAPIAVLPDTKLREIVGGRIGGAPLPMQHENQVFTTP